MIQVFITAPTPVMRAGLRSLLASSEIEVVGEGANLDNLSAEVERDKVDVLIVADPALLREIGRGVLANRAALALVVLADDEQTVTALSSLSLGGWAVLSPDAPGPELRTAVNAAYQGLTVLPRPLAEKLLGQRSPGEALEVGPFGETLTGREQEVLELLSQGLSNKLIARQLQISEHTVKFHVSSLYAKLDASSRAEAVSRGARLGLITF